ncbi:hypothetical protein [Halomonas cerina]|uniref:Uncharacterized protein n=1 Tax=Halomonas cerina TaxID=447424 RepID=A0A839V8C1_9GAMM|nr:hypothetical protein [Halomonas cerina]MBB3188954.1 hypothetical protein [Halomonas cerina]
MQGFWLPLTLTVAFGAFIGTLFRLSRRPGSERPLMFPLVGMLGGLTAFVIHQLLLWLVGAPAWLLPLLVILQIWLWLGPLGPRIARRRN